jgi:hypothetical protein
MLKLLGEVSRHDLYYSLTLISQKTGGFLLTMLTNSKHKNISKW